MSASDNFPRVPPRGGVVAADQSADTSWWLVRTYRWDGGQEGCGQAFVDRVRQSVLGRVSVEGETGVRGRQRKETWKVLESVGQPWLSPRIRSGDFYKLGGRRLLLGGTGTPRVTT